MSRVKLLVFLAFSCNRPYKDLTFEGVGQGNKHTYTWCGTIHSHALFLAFIHNKGLRMKLLVSRLKYSHLEKKNSTKRPIRFSDLVLEDSVRVGSRQRVFDYMDQPKHDPINNHVKTP